MKLFEDDIREFEDGINIIDVKCRLSKLHLEGNSEGYLRGFVDCIAMLQLICIAEWDDLKEYVSKIQACN